MAKTWIFRGAAALVALTLLGFGGWLRSLPAAPAGAVAPPVPREEAAALLAALEPRRRARPLIAVVGINDATETTDYLMPTGILRRANVADVVMLSTGPGPVQLYPALRVDPDMTIGEFDTAHPEGADYVIVPAMSRDDEPAVLAWLRDQSAKSATILGICAGAKVVGAAGLLDGRRATTHWYYLDDLLRRSPTIDYVPDRRMVADGRVVTTTGISASIPMMLTLIEAIAGRTKAKAVARDLGVVAWDARHASAMFRLTRPFATTVLRNGLAFWNRETLGLHLEPGTDEVSLALVADAWSRTYRSRVLAVAAPDTGIVTANGIRVLPDRTTRHWPQNHRIPPFEHLSPASALDESLSAIVQRYGAETEDIVAMQLEYPRNGGRR